MCGRAYSTFTDDEMYFRYVNRKGWSLAPDTERIKLKPNYNMCPTHVAPVLCIRGAQPGFHQMRWGLVPGWAKSVKDADKYSMINAKSEEIAEKRSYKAAFQSRRCIVPISGFYEWKREGKTKTPYAISLVDEPIMSIAGIWEHWESPENGDIVESFSIVTTSANEFMQQIHTRMPVILNPEQEDIWLGKENVSSTELKQIMTPCSPGILQSRRISSLINSPRNNSPAVLEAAE